MNKGPNKKLTQAQQDKVYSMYKKGFTTADIMAATGHSERVVQKYMPASIRAKKAPLRPAK